MTTTFSSESDKSGPRLHRRTLLKAAAGTAATVGAYGVLDGVSRDTLAYGTDITLLQRTIGGKVLFVCAPGIVAKIDRQAAPIIPTMSKHGDVMLVQPTGDRYNDEESAEITAEAAYDQMKKRDYAHVAFVGVSLGGMLLGDVIALMGRNGSFNDVSTEPVATMIDAPTSLKDIASARQRAFTESMSMPPYGRISNLFPHPNWVSESINPETTSPRADIEHILASAKWSNAQELSMFRDQAHAIATHDEFPEGSLASLAAFVYWESIRGVNLVDADSARPTWFNAVADDNKVFTVRANMTHADIEGQPVEARRALTRAMGLQALL